MLYFRCNVQFAQLKLPQSPSYSVPIEPGIFKGTYGEHGIEMVLLQYTGDKYVEGIKVTVSKIVDSLLFQYVKISILWELCVYNRLDGSLKVMR